jgi:hypothetical protein
MEEEQNNHNVNGASFSAEPERMPHHAEGFRNVPHASEGFGTVPHGSETFRTVRNDSEGFRMIPHHSERSENHTLTVKEASRMFEDAGVARTERSIVNWCQPNKMGMPRLDNYFDANERKYFITQQSVEMAISEEKAKAAKNNNAPSEPVGNVRKDAERVSERPGNNSEENPALIQKLEQEVMDLTILNKSKDYFINELQKERKGVYDQLMAANREMGELETKLLQLEGPKK